eukprot:255668-Chlamydomonas_euryale.AAC.4
MEQTPFMHACSRCCAWSTPAWVAVTEATAGAAAADRSSVSRACGVLSDGPHASERCCCCGGGGGCREGDMTS